MKVLIDMLITSGVIKRENDQLEVSKDDCALFTKKPLGGLSCASCDKQLGSVSPLPSGHFAQWNKMPARDPLDRLPRSGQGFSKMLQNIRTPTVKDYIDINEDTAAVTLDNNSSVGTFPQQNISIFNPSQTKTLQKGSKSTRSYVILPFMNQTQQIRIDTSMLPKMITPRKNVSPSQNLY